MLAPGRFVFIMFLTVLAGTTGQSVALGEATVLGDSAGFVIRMCSRGDKRTMPFIYPPGFRGDGDQMVIEWDAKKVGAKHMKWRYPETPAAGHDFSIEVFSRCTASPGLCCQVACCQWHCRFTFGRKFMHQIQMPYEYVTTNDTTAEKNPVAFKMPAEYDEFWNNYRNWVKTQPHPDRIQDVEAQRLFSEFFLRNRPQTFEDSLLAAYALEIQGRAPKAEGAYIDIVPDMRIRLEFGNWQTFAATDGDSDDSGYVTSGQTYLSVHVRHRHELSGQLPCATREFLAFEPFLGFLEALRGIPKPSPEDIKFPRKASGTADMNVLSNQKRFCRLHVPASYFQGDAPKNNSPRTNFVFISDDCRDRLKVENCNRWIEKPWKELADTDPQVTAFRGRALVIPEVLLQIGNERQYVPIGATFRQEVLRITDWDRLGKSGVKLSRLFEGSLYPVRFVGPDSQVFELPLVKGDVIK